MYGPLDPTGKWGATCYICKEEIPANATNWSFCFGSDGFYPDEASAMYCCWNCRDFWIKPPGKELWNEEKARLDKEFWNEEKARREKKD